MKFWVRFVCVQSAALLLLFNMGFSESDKGKPTVPPVKAIHDACKLPPKGKGDDHGVCKHCGCRIQYSKDDMEKTCTACKCGKKTKECIYHH